jgi:hypothetical protein
MSWCSPSVAPASLVCVRLLRAISAPGLGSARPPTSAPRLGSPPQAEAREREKRNEARRKEQEAASPSHICTMNLRIPATFAPGQAHPCQNAMGLGSPLPHLHRDWAHTLHICTETGSRVTCTATGLTPPHLQQDWGSPRHICNRTGLSQSAAAFLVRPFRSPCRRPRRHGMLAPAPRGANRWLRFRRSATRGRSAVMLSAPRRSCARVRQARSKELQREIEFLRELNNSLLKNQKTLLVGLPRPSVATARICGCVSPHPFPLLGRSCRRCASRKRQLRTAPSPRCSGRGEYRCGCDRGRAQSRCRCGRGEPSPGVSPVPG